ncbi:SulP family inorganic anion transporter [Telmatospirillum siberiense]|uniref:SulP family inorganic anion transporter n=1 Tax=Telmatospirillum siberiense TaxID=382514 RepID=UPI0018ECD090|nr:SulP family inorganic anion transporter [Telmatospirillum siberiense]
MDVLHRDVIAGVTLAAIAIPEQMATAHLGGFPPEIGFFAFIAGSLAFAVFGVSRFLSAGADSTITPIFTGGLVLLAATGTAEYAGMAAIVALIVGIILIGGGLCRLGWIADLLSGPVITGFLAGVSIHVIVSQLPGLLGISITGEHVVRRLAGVLTGLDRTNLHALALGLGVLVFTIASDRITPRIPGALIGILAATACVLGFGLEHRGVAVLGPVTGGLPSVIVPATTPDQLIHLVPLALIVSIIVMVQTAATTRSFPSDPGETPDVNRDFIGIGVGNILAGLCGAFPVNASPPRTAIVQETGGRSQMAGLMAAALVLGLVTFGSGLLFHVPQAALAGILIFIAFRIFRIRDMVEIYHRTFTEFILVIVTMVAIVALPIETGVAVGIVLSLLHGMWSAMHARLIEFVHVPGTSIWWAPNTDLRGETLPGVVVIAFQAPLSFLNANDFRRGLQDALERRPKTPDLVVLEAGNIIALDYTASKVVAAIIRHCQAAGIAFAVARLESVRAQEAFSRFGITDILGRDHLFHSVDEAVRTLAPAGANNSRPVSRG